MVVPTPKQSSPSNRGMLFSGQQKNRVHQDPNNHAQRRDRVLTKGSARMVLKFLLLVLCFQILAVAIAEDDKSSVDAVKAMKSQAAISRKVILVKIGGSSITNKSEYESLNQEALSWFSSSIAAAISDDFLAPREESKVDCPIRQHGRVETVDSRPIASREDDSGLAFVLIHGAGSFGHFLAKEFGLKGQSMAPPSRQMLTKDEMRYQKQGLAKTRLSVQRLNRNVVESLLESGVNAVGISPCFGVPGVEAHSGSSHHDGDEPISAPRATLSATVLRTIQAGLVPVLHGDACLYGQQDVGILSGDTLMEIIGTDPWISEAVFITDVDGVFNEDPRKNPGARLLRQISVDPRTGDITTELKASGSSHEHDVTGGLQTKLKSASTIAAAGENVSIVKHSTRSAENALSQLEFEPGSVIYLLTEGGI